VKHLIIRAIGAAGICFAIAGCATHAVYFYDGKQYPSADAFYSGIQSLNRPAVDEIVPLPAPVTNRRLAFGFPAPDAVLAGSVRNHTALKGQAPVGLALEQYTTLAQSTALTTRATFDAIQRRGIYKSVRYVPLDSLTSSLAASADEDVLYWYEPAPSAGTWYFVSAKSGKQVFAYDRAQPSVAARMKAFVDALQLQAVRD
jgi:hypothetical protein